MTDVPFLVLDEFECESCGYTMDAFRESKDRDPKKECPKCQGVMGKVWNPQVVNDSNSLTFAHISPERKFEIKAERMRVRAKHDKSKVKREESSNVYNDMKGHKS